MYTTTEAAALLETARRNVQNYCKRHALTKRGRDYDISEQDIEGMKTELGKPGRKLANVATSVAQPGEISDIPHSNAALPL